MSVAPIFANPRRLGNGDIAGIGDDLSPETLRLAYRLGIFPWPMDGYPLLWFCPRRRAVLDFASLHVPRRLARLTRTAPYTFTIDMAFGQVIDNCRAVPRPGQDGTWITPALQDAYLTLHTLGLAHSVEAWDTHGTLVGGLYGVDSGGVFAGESMFHTRPNASKLALLFLLTHLQSRGLTWIDIQMMTPHMAVLGAAELPRTAYLDRLEAAQTAGLTLFGDTRRA